ncbi:MAG TPA: hypothetical protein VL742_01895 [Casimicrobiaceae bacterium]|nr:hypothetical protein [Casimicrobiaceae bacterium]
MIGFARAVIPSRSGLRIKKMKQARVGFVPAGFVAAARAGVRSRRWADRTQHRTRHVTQGADKLMVSAQLSGLSPGGDGCHIHVA